MNLDDLDSQIKAKAKEVVMDDTGYDPDRDEELGMYKPKLVDFELRSKYYRKGAYSYSEKWHESEQLKERYEQALKDVISPIAYLQRKAAEEGSSLNGYFAQELANTVSFLQKIASEALTPKTSTDE